MTQNMSPDERMRVFERLRRLIAVGGAEEGPNFHEEEARTAARAACQLILRYGIPLEGGAPGEPMAKKAAPTSAADGFQRHAREAARRAKPPSGVDKAAAAWGMPIDDADPATQSWGAVPGRGKPSDVIVTMKAKKFSRCCVCDRNLSVGDRIAWHRKANKAACLTPCGQMLMQGLNL